MSTPGLIGRWWRRGVARWRGDRVETWRIVCDADEVACVGERVDGLASDRPSIRWRDVDQVAAFKIDLLAVDQIRIQLARADGSALEITEDMGGFGDLVESLPTFLAGFPPCASWWGGVMLPPFDTNWTVLWTRAGGSALE